MGSLFSLRLFNPQGAFLATVSVTATIRDNDGLQQNYLPVDFREDRGKLMRSFLNKIGGHKNRTLYLEDRCKPIPTGC
jgi:hypothetical protein